MYNEQTNEEDKIKNTFPLSPKPNLLIRTKFISCCSCEFHGKDERLVRRQADYNSGGKYRSWLINGRQSFLRWFVHRQEISIIILVRGSESSLGRPRAVLLLLLPSSSSLHVSFLLVAHLPLYLCRAPSSHLSNQSSRILFARRPTPIFSFSFSFFFFDVPPAPNRNICISENLRNASLSFANYRSTPVGGNQQPRNRSNSHFCTGASLGYHGYDEIISF